MSNGRYYSKGKKRGRPGKKGSSRVKSTSTTLGKAKRSEVKSIVKKVMYSVAESKYFNTTNMSSLTRLQPYKSRTGSTALAAMGFAVGTGESPQSSGITYGNNGVNTSVIDLNCSRLFGAQDPDAPTDSLFQNALEGSYCQPSMCRTEWYLQIPQQNTTNSNNFGTPMMVRIVRVKPRKQKYADLSINPKNDLFVNQYGVEQGINFSSFNEMELTMFKVNARKYEVVEDTTKFLVPASTTATLEIANGNTITTDLTARGSNCKLVMNHKQPKRLYYKNASIDGTQPQDGQSNELIFFHFVKQGARGDANSNEADIEITCKPISTFKDI